MMVELKQHEQVLHHPGFPGITLNRDFLTELALKRRAGVPMGANGVSFSNSRVADDPFIGPSIEQLYASGRIKLKQDMPKHAPIGGGPTGSTVLRFATEQSGRQLAENINITDLGPLLDFYEQFGPAIQSATITPNMTVSTSKLKGVEIQFDPTRANKWWQIAGRMPWSFGRGIIVAALPIDINDFLNRADDISEQIFRVAQIAYQPGSLQHVNIGISPDNRVAIELSAGLSEAESREVRRRLTTMQKIADVREEMRQLETAMRERRIQMVTGLAGISGIDPAGIELLGQGAHTNLETDTSTIHSGVIHTESDPQSPNPMNSGTGQILLLNQYDNPVVPVGIPIQDERAYIPPAPRNVEKKILGRSTKIRIPQLDEISQLFLERSKPLVEIEVVVAPFDKDYRPRSL